jgi:hypothetical protein
LSTASLGRRQVWLRVVYIFGTFPGWHGNASEARAGFTGNDEAVTMTGRTRQRYLRKDNQKPISDEDIYCMLMQHKYQRTSIRRLAQKFSLTETQVRTIIGRRTGGSCCG